MADDPEDGGTGDGGGGGLFIPISVRLDEFTVTDPTIPNTLEITVTAQGWQDAPDLEPLPILSFYSTSLTQPGLGKEEMLKGPTPITVQLNAYVSDDVKPQKDVPSFQGYAHYILTLQPSDLTALSNQYLVVMATGFSDDNQTVSAIGTVFIQSPTS